LVTGRRLSPPCSRAARSRVAVAFLSLLGLPGLATAEGVAIQHQAPACVAAEKYPRLDACFSPVNRLARARVYFRPTGTADWFYVEMKGAPPCLQGLLPRPKKTLPALDYYVAAIDRSSVETRTEERRVRVVQGKCEVGPLAPFATAGAVTVGSLTGAVPAGFILGGGAGLSPLLIAGGAAVVAGGVVIAVGGGGDGGTTTTTTSTTTSTTTTTTTTSTTTTTTTTTTLPCETTPPSAAITSPISGAQLPAVSTVTATAADAGSGVKHVAFYYRSCPGAIPTSCGSRTLMSPGPNPDSTPPYSVEWALPPCPGDDFIIMAEAEDKCGNRTPSGEVLEVIVSRFIKCFRSLARTPVAAGWRSELAVPGGRGQVVLDGREAIFAEAGMAGLALAIEPGLHRFEATLVEGAGKSGVWRFDLTGLGLLPGSLRVIAGEVVQVAGDELTFRLKGQSGERIVFSFRVQGSR